MRQQSNGVPSSVKSCLTSSAELQHVAGPGEELVEFAHVGDGDAGST